MVPSCSAAQYYPKYLIWTVSDLKRKSRFHFFENPPPFLRGTVVKPFRRIFFLMYSLICFISLSPDWDALIPYALMNFWSMKYLKSLTLWFGPCCSSALQLHTLSVILVLLGSVLLVGLVVYSFTSWLFDLRRFVLEYEWFSQIFIIELFILLGEKNEKSLNHGIVVATKLRRRNS